MIDPSLQKKHPSRWRYPLRSLFFHIIILITLISFELHFRNENELEELKKTLEVRPLTEEEFKKLFPGAQVVQTDIDLKSQINDPNKKAKYLGEKTQRVTEESVAPTKDIREQNSKQKSSAQKKGKKTGKNEKLSQKEKSKDGFGAQVKGEQKSQLQKSSPSSNLLLDSSVKISTITLLNTDEYVYASFYNRMRDAFASRWSEFLNDYFDIDSSIRLGIYKTEAQFVLAKTGEIVSVKLLTSSSIASLDKLGMKAIQETKWLQNPPTDLFDAGKKTTELKFTFMLSVTPSRAYQFHFIPDRRLLRRR
jgi:hypothetical protein